MIACPCEARPATPAIVPSSSSQSACGTTQAVGQTTVTSAESDGVDVYLARGDARRCPTEIAPSIEFEPHTSLIKRSETSQLDAWAACLKLPELSHATVVLLQERLQAQPIGERALPGARHAVKLYRVDKLS